MNQKLNAIAFEFINGDQRILDEDGVCIFDPLLLINQFIMEQCSF